MKKISNKLHADHRSLLHSADLKITLLQGLSNYTLLQNILGEKQIMAYSLNQYENVLSASFIRVHKSFIINRGFIKNIDYHLRIITLFDDVEVPISRRRWSDIKHSLQL